jgi:hypothetical protein
MTNANANDGKTSPVLPTLEQVYALLKANYKPARFADRDGEIWGHEYSWNLARSSLQDRRNTGKSYVSKHSDRMGDGFSFGPDRSLFADIRTEVSKMAGCAGELE